MTNGDRIRAMNNNQLAALIDDSRDFFSCNECPCEEGSSECERGCLPFIMNFLNQEISYEGEMKKYKIYRITNNGRKGPRNKDVDDIKYDGMVNSIIESYDIEYLQPFQCYRFNFIKTDTPYKAWYTSEVIGLKKNWNEEKNIYILETINSLYYLEEIEE